MFLEISQNSQENTCTGVSFLRKLRTLACNFIKKETLAQVFSCEFCEISESTFFTESFCWPLLKGRSNFQKNGLESKREREREREGEREIYQNEETILSMFRIVSTDTSLVYPADTF